jgi:hypothetical protein
MGNIDPKALDQRLAVAGTMSDKNHLGVPVSPFTQNEIDTLQSNVLKNGSHGLNSGAIAEAVGMDRANVNKCLNSKRLELRLDGLLLWVQKGSGRAPTMVLRKVSLLW